MTRHLWMIVALCIAGLCSSAARAEPWFAIQTGAKCLQCHANPSGGGLRNVYGNAWAQTQLAARRLGPQDEELWTGQIGRFLAFGGNARADAAFVRVPNQNETSEFATSEARLYVQAEVIPDRLAISVDERVAPGNATNLEANARLWLRQGVAYVKAGKLYLPFGWRLEDDNAFVRQLSGINMQTPDDGVEIGLDRGSWSTQLALSNGSGGGPETDDGKQITARTELVRPIWRIGASAALNASDAGDRAAAALFAGFRLGRTGWLAELDYVDDEGLGVDGRQSLASLVEVNWLVRQGHNVKATYEWLDPDDAVSEDEQTRASLLYEWSAVQFLQLRIGVRRFDGIPQNDLQNRTQAFVQLHAFF